MTARNRTREAVRATDPADELRADLRRLVAIWPDLLEAQLGAAADLNPGPVTGTKDHGIKVGFRAIATVREITNAAWFVARVIADETSTAPPDPLRDLPAMLDWTAQWRADWLARHPDLGPGLVDEWHRHANRAHGVVYAERARVVRVGVPCPEHGTDDLGDRVACPGELQVTLTAATETGTVPDLVCTEDTTHRIAPEEWFRAARRGGYEPERIGQVLAERRA